MSVPVLDTNKIPLMPCSEKRAKHLMNKDQAKPYWQYFTCPTPQAKSDLMAFLEIMSNAGFKKDER